MVGEASASPDLSRLYRIYISRGRTALGYRQIDETFTLLGSHLAQKVFRIKRRSTFLASDV